MTIDQIIKVDIAISEAMAIDGGYDTILIIGPLPRTPGGHMTPDVAGYTGTQDLKSAGFSTDDPVYIAASKVFAQSPKATMVMVAVQKTTSGSTEKVDATLDRAKAVPGWYCICPAGIKEDFYQSIADWTESNEKFCVCETTGISASPVSDAMFRTAVVHATKENDCVNAAYAAKFLSYEPGSELWAYKSLSMVEAQSLSTTDVANLESRNVSYYTTIGSQAMVQGGKVSAGEWIDTIRFRDWLKTQIQQNVINLMLSLPKIPYTDPGIGLVQNAVTAALDAGVEAGGIARPSSDETTDGHPVLYHHRTEGRGAGCGNTQDPCVAESKMDGTVGGCADRNGNQRYAELLSERRCAKWLVAVFTFILLRMSSAQSAPICRAALRRITASPSRSRATASPMRRVPTVRS